jgi:toxin-antitoxin system PIN domain toxin
VIALLDVNILVALFDPSHSHHEAAHRWFETNRAAGWASCPLTENGFVRVLSNPAYPGRRTTVADAVERLSRFRTDGGHTFWADEVSICESEFVRAARIGGHRRVTDVYLLALAVHNGGRLASFDRKISLLAVRKARAENLALIG